MDQIQQISGENPLKLNAPESRKVKPHKGKKNESQVSKHISQNPDPKIYKRNTHSQHKSALKINVKKN